MKIRQKVLLIIGIILSVLLFIVNIVTASLFPTYGANIFTAISGWVSGIATIILGVIALYVNSKYKKDNDERIWKSRLIEQLENYKKEIFDIFNDFKQTNCMEILEQLMLKELDDTPTLLDIIEIEKIDLRIVNMFFGLSFCHFYIDLKDELFKNYSKYMKKLVYIIENASKIIFDKQFDVVMETKELYGNVMMYFKMYLVKIDTFIEHNILKKSKTELKSIIDEHSKRQLEWWNDNIKTIKLEKNNGQTQNDVNG